jgi:hypothetical protein
VARRVYHVVDGAGDIPDLRRGVFARPLSTRLKVVATTVGAIASIGGYAIGMGRWTVAKIDEQVTAIVRRENAPIVSSIQASDHQRNEQFARTSADLAELKAAVAKMATEKRRR